MEGFSYDEFCKSPQCVVQQQKRDEYLHIGIKSAEWYNLEQDGAEVAESKAAQDTQDTTAHKTVVALQHVDVRYLASSSRGWGGS